MKSRTSLRSLTTPEDILRHLVKRDVREVHFHVCGIRKTWRPMATRALFAGEAQLRRCLFNVVNLFTVCALTPLPGDYVLRTEDGALNYVPEGAGHVALRPLRSVPPKIRRREAVAA